MSSEADKAFVIMQIGNSDLDHVYEAAIAPAIVECSLSPIRVDRHNEGGLLKSEIIKFLEQAQIIVADITNERPNCYLEIGYTMGIGKFRNLILTVREDHFPESENFRNGGPKVHFDLGGYDILAWSPDELRQFKDDLTRRIRRRLAIVSPGEAESAPPSNTWLNQHRESALKGLKNSGLDGAMEIQFQLSAPKPSFTLGDINEAARTSTIDTFGWPIGIYLENRDEYRPRPRPDGIVAEVSIEDKPSYDYWAISKQADFYGLISYFEDRRVERAIFFDTAIVRVTESLLYCARLYSRLGVDPTSKVKFEVTFSGLKGRKLLAANSARHLSIDRESDSDAISASIDVSLQSIESDLTGLVRELVSPLFEMFDFFELGDKIYEDIVTKFVNRKSW